MFAELLTSAGTCFLDAQMRLALTICYDGTRVCTVQRAKFTRVLARDLNDEQRSNSTCKRRVHEHELCSAPWKMTTVFLGLPAATDVAGVAEDDQQLELGIFNFACASHVAKMDLSASGDAQSRNSREHR